ETAAHVGISLVPARLPCSGRAGLREDGSRAGRMEGESVMWRATCLLIVLAAAAPAAAQDYTVLAISHLDNKVSEIHPTGLTLREFVVPGGWFGETHEGAVTPDGKTM